MERQALEVTSHGRNITGTPSGKSGGKGREWEVFEVLWENDVKPALKWSKKVVSLSDGGPAVTSGKMGRNGGQ